MPQIHYNTNLGNYNPQIKGDLKMTNATQYTRANFVATSTWTIGDMALRYDTIIADDGDISWIKEDRYGNREIFQPTIETTASGYQRVRLPLANGGSKRVYVHQIMATIFYGTLTSKDNGLAVHHVNGNKQDNRVDNLKIITQAENVRYYNHVETQREVAPYNDERIKEGRVTLRLNGQLLPEYSIDITGNVFRWKNNEWVELKRYVANKNYPSNITINVNNHMYSLGKLMAENFMELDSYKNYRVFQKDVDGEYVNNFFIKNLYATEQSRKVGK